MCQPHWKKKKKKKRTRKKENSRQKGNEDQDASWDDPHNLDSFSENNNANFQNKSHWDDENSRYVGGILTKNNWVNTEKAISLSGRY